MLTLRQNERAKRQDAARQSRRTKEEAVEIRKVRQRTGSAAVIGVSHYLTVSAILLVIGVFGIFLNRKNVIVILMSIELILLAVNIQLRRLLRGR